MQSVVCSSAVYDTTVAPLPDSLTIFLAYPSRQRVILLPPPPPRYLLLFSTWYFLVSLSRVTEIDSGTKTTFNSGVMLEEKASEQKLNPFWCFVEKHSILTNTHTHTHTHMVVWSNPIQSNRIKTWPCFFIVFRVAAKATNTLIDWLIDCLHTRRDTTRAYIIILLSLDLTWPPVYDYYSHHFFFMFFIFCYLLICLFIYFLHIYFSFVYLFIYFIFTYLFFICFFVDLLSLFIIFFGLFRVASLEDNLRKVYSVVAMEGGVHMNSIGPAIESQLDSIPLRCVWIFLGSTAV